MTEPTGVDEPRHITIAFDGACKGNPGPGGYGAILVNERTGAEKIVKGCEQSDHEQQDGAIGSHRGAERPSSWCRGHDARRQSVRGPGHHRMAARVEGTGMEGSRRKAGSERGALAGA